MTRKDDPLGPGPEEEDAVLAAEYVLRLLGPEEEAAAEMRERRDPRFAAEVAAWRASFASLDAEIAPVSPSQAVWRAMERRLFGARHSAWRQAWGNLRFLRALASFATVGTVVVAVLHFAAHRPLTGEEAPRLISALATVAAARPAEFLALLEPAAGVLNIVRVAGEPGPGRDFELWFVQENAGPVSLGVLPEQEKARIPLGRELGQRIAADGALAVSEEPEGGSPTGAPTGDVLAVGPLREL